MILNHELILRLLKGTPLESLTEEQLDNAFVGEYPIIYGSNQLARKWERISQTERIKFDLKAMPFEELLDSWRFKILSKGKDHIEENSEKLEMITEAQGFIIDARLAFEDALAAKSMLMDVNPVVVKYEKEIRELKSQIKALNNCLECK